MSNSFCHYYIQAEPLGDSGVRIVPHTKDGKKSYHEFLNRKKAIDFMKATKLKHSTTKFRLVKETHTFNHGKWE